MNFKELYKYDLNNNLDSRIEIIEGIEFEIKPLDQIGLEKLGMFANENMSGVAKKSEEAQAAGLRIINNPRFSEVMNEIAPQHITMLGSFQIQENGKLREGTLEDIFTINSGSLLTLKTKLFTALMTGSNLTEKETDQLKK